MIDHVGLLEEMDRAYLAGQIDIKRVVLNYLEGRITGHVGCRGFLSTCESCLGFRQVINFIEKEI